MAARNQTVEVQEVEVTPEMEAEAIDLVNVALASRKAFDTQIKYVAMANPKLVELTLEKLEKVLISRQLAAVSVQMIPKDDRPEGSEDFIPLLTDFIACINKANSISRTIFPLVVVNSSGSGDSQKEKRVIKWDIGDEHVKFEISKKVLGKKEGIQPTETIEEVESDESL